MMNHPCRSNIQYPMDGRGRKVKAKGKVSICKAVSLTSPWTVPWRDDDDARGCGWEDFCVGCKKNTIYLYV